MPARVFARDFSISLWVDALSVMSIPDAEVGESLRLFM
jgi:hypothetical protein